MDEMNNVEEFILQKELLLLFLQKMYNSPEVSVCFHFSIDGMLYLYEVEKTSKNYFF